MTQPSHDTFAAFIGIDWADAKHDLCLQAAGTAKRRGVKLNVFFALSFAAPLSFVP